MSAMPVSRLAESADLLALIGDTASRLAQTAIRPRLHAFDSANSAEAWVEISGDLHRNGLLDPPFDSADRSSPKMIAAVLREVAGACPGVATGLWSHYSACLPYRLSGRTLARTELLASSFLGSSDTPPLRSFGATAAARAVDYSESDAAVTLRHVPILSEATPEGLLGLRACRFGSLAAESGPEADSMPLVLNLPSARALIRESEAISLAWLAAIAASNAASAILEAREYARSRYQGCGLLIDHPVIRQMLGRMEMQNAAALALADKATESRNFVQAGLAKAFATSSSEQICSEAVQVLGGYGYMEDYGMEKRLRDAKTLCVLGRPNRTLMERAAATERGGTDGN